MKPEPLTKEKIREAFEKWYFSKPLIPHGLMWTEHSYEGFKAGVEFMKQRVEWLLKEIEKLDRLELEEFSDERFDNLHDPEEVIAHCVDYFRFLVKKAFEGVIE